MRSQQVVGRADGVEVAGEVQVDVLHGDDLRVAAAGGAALDAEHRAEGRLTQRNDDVLADAGACASARPTVVVVLPSPAGVGLMAVTRTSLPWRVLSHSLQDVVVDLGLVVAVLLQVLLVARPRSCAISLMGCGVAAWAISMSVNTSGPLSLSGCGRAPSFGGAHRT